MRPSRTTTAGRSGIASRVCLRPQTPQLEVGLCLFAISFFCLLLLVLLLLTGHSGSTTTSGRAHYAHQHGNRHTALQTVTEVSFQMASHRNLGYRTQAKDLYPRSRSRRDPFVWPARRWLWSGQYLALANSRPAAHAKDATRIRKRRCRVGALEHPIVNHSIL